MVRSRRLELPRALAHSALNAARLPVPPRPPKLECAAHIAKHSVSRKPKTVRARHVQRVDGLLAVGCVGLVSRCGGGDCGPSRGRRIAISGDRPVFGHSGCVARIAARASYSVVMICRTATSRTRSGGGVPGRLASGRNRPCRRTIEMTALSRQVKLRGGTPGNSSRHRSRWCTRFSMCPWFLTVAREDGFGAGPAGLPAAPEHRMVVPFRSGGVERRKAALFENPVQPDRSRRSPRGPVAGSSGCPSIVVTRSSPPHASTRQRAVPRWTWMASRVTVQPLRSRCR